MKIAIVASHPGLFLPPRPCDSVARVINSQIIALLELGHKVTLLAPASSQLPSLQTHGSLELISICEKPVSVEDDPTGSMSMEIIRRAKEMLYKMKRCVDVVQTHSLNIPGLLFTSDFLDDCKLPHVTTIHSCIEIANLHKFQKCIGPFIALSQNQTKACPNLHYIDVIHNGLDPAPFRVYSASIEGVGMNINEDRECKECREIKKGGNSAEQYICFLGRITPEKQPYLALELADYLGLPIKIAGPILDKQYFEEKCKPFLSSSQAEYLGVLDMEAKIKLLSKAVCNLHPTGFRDPCPLVPIEAGMCGTPTIAIKRGALPEITEDHETGILVEDFTEAAFKFEEILKLDRKHIAEEYCRLFNHIEMAKKYVKVYESLKPPTKFYQHHNTNTNITKKSMR